MVQLNEETGNRRPVMLCIPTAEDKYAAKDDKAATAATTSTPAGAASSSTPATATPGKAGLYSVFGLLTNVMLNCPSALRVHT
jgi:hypothetical protein